MTTIIPCIWCEYQRFVFQLKNTRQRCNSAVIGYSLLVSEGERPLKLLEYGAAGLTVLGIPGRRQNILSDEEVYYITPSSVRIAEALDTIRLSPDQVPATGLALQEYVKKNSWDNVDKIYYDVFRELTGD